jgi:hypothetical protein
MNKKQIVPEDIMAMSEFAKIRSETRTALIPTKRKRRVGVGPCAMFYFESYETMWFQVHEMLFIEGGGEAQLIGELEAYNPLIPQGRALVATLMFEVENPVERAHLLTRLRGVEKGVSFLFGDYQVSGVVEEEIGRPRLDGKVSSVHFVHFAFSDEAAAAFQNSSDVISLRIDHPSYKHNTILEAGTRNELAMDFDTP